jgi:ketosteroid isomerase-like protein
MSTTWTSMFADIDRMDAEAWASHLSDDVVMRFGNADPVHGREACRDALAAFYETIDGVSHSIVGQWETGDAAVFESNVTYTRKDGKDVTVPVVTIARTNDERVISDYRVYIDLAPVFA